MKETFRKLIQQQIQEDLNNPARLKDKPAPKGGWLQTIRTILGLSARQLAKKMGCSQVNITAFERREREGTISLNALNKVAQAMDCHLVYFLVPKEPFKKLLENRARIVARRYLQRVGVSMELEDQGLKPAQRKHQERELVNEFLQNSPKKLWD